MHGKVAHFCLKYVYKFGDSLPSSNSLLTLALPGVSVLLGHQSGLTSFRTAWENVDVSVPGYRVRRTFIVDLRVSTALRGVWKSSAWTWSADRGSERKWERNRERERGKEERRKERGLEGAQEPRHETRDQEKKRPNKHVDQEDTELK